MYILLRKILMYFDLRDLKTFATAVYVSALDEANQEISLWDEIHVALG